MKINYIARKPMSKSKWVLLEIRREKKNTEINDEIGNSNVETVLYSFQKKKKRVEINKINPCNFRALISLK